MKTRISWQPPILFLAVLCLGVSIGRHSAFAATTAAPGTSAIGSVLKRAPNRSLIIIQPTQNQVGQESKLFVQVAAVGVSDSTNLPAYVNFHLLYDPNRRPTPELYTSLTTSLNDLLKGVPVPPSITQHNFGLWQISACVRLTPSTGNTNGPQISVNTASNSDLCSPVVQFQLAK